MSELKGIADRFEIEALRGEFTDAGMMRDYDRFAALFTQDGVWRIPHVGVEFVSRGEIRAGIERLGGLWDYFVQTPHPGTIHLDGDTAVGRSYIAEFGHGRDGTSHSNYGVYHDRYKRTPDGWKFTQRVYEVVYLDTTPLAGSAPDAARGGRRPAGVDPVWDQVCVSPESHPPREVRMERLWSRAVATHGNRWQMGRARKRRRKAKTVAVGCHRLPRR